MEGPTTEKARRCLSAERARGTRAHLEPKNEGLGGKLNPKPAYTYISQVRWGTTTTMQLQIARQVLQFYSKCVGRQEAMQMMKVFYAGALHGRGSG